LPASFTAQEANDLIRFFRGEPMKSWGIQFDEFSKKNQDYIIFQSMSATCTFPFPPILIDPQLLTGAGWRECGRPLHLIEGTHRVSYLRRMLELGLVDPESRHQFVLLKPRDGHRRVIEFPLGPASNGRNPKEKKRLRPKALSSSSWTAISRSRAGGKS
jgi:hypothetical protein